MADATLADQCWSVARSALKRAPTGTSRTRAALSRAKNAAPATASVCDDRANNAPAYYRIPARVRNGTSRDSGGLTWKQNIHLDRGSTT